ncbi:hypothetical protein WMY93_029157 [Mugilogobius chulae]|uniref:C1q domain-containing protein n=1 Tax=Mugilogobius chulae TaxID=88201 RepID=A0AAW0MQI4_9GOBI
MDLQTRVQNLETAPAQQQRKLRPVQQLNHHDLQERPDNDGNGYNPATVDPVQVRPVTGTFKVDCHRYDLYRYDPVTGTTCYRTTATGMTCHRYDLPRIPCHRYDPATGMTLHRYDPVTGTSNPVTGTPARYDPATGTTLSQYDLPQVDLPQVTCQVDLHRCDPAQYDLSQYDLHSTTLSRYDPATGTTATGDSATGVFQASVKGMYSFHVRLFSTYSPTPNLNARLKKNTQILGLILDEASSDTHDSSTLSVVVPLEVGDSVFVELGSGKSVYANNGNFNNFCGFLIYPM